MAERIRWVSLVVDVADAEILLIDGSTNATREAIREVAADPPPLDDPSRASDGGTNPLASGYGATPGHQPVPSACVPTSMFHVKRSNAVHGADLSPGARYQYRRHVAMPGRRRWHSRGGDPHTSDSEGLSPGVSSCALLSTTKPTAFIAGGRRGFAGGMTLAAGRSSQSTFHRCNGSAADPAPTVARAPAPAPECLATGAARKWVASPGAAAWLSMFDVNGR
jgi:hypothetical protein